MRSNARSLITPRADVTGVDVLGHVNTHSLQGGTGEGRCVLGTQPLPRHRDRNDEDAADDADRIAEGVADRRVRIPGEPGGRVEGGSGRQSTREETRREAGRQAEEATTREGDNRSHDAHDRCQREEVRLLTQVLEEGRSRGNADAIYEEGQAHRLDD